MLNNKELLQVGRRGRFIRYVDTAHGWAPEIRVGRVEEITPDHWLIVQDGTKEQLPRDVWAPYRE